MKNDTLGIPDAGYAVCDLSEQLHHDLDGVSDNAFLISVQLPAW